MCVCHEIFQRPENYWGLKFSSESNILVRNYFFLKNYVTSEGAVYHNVLYHKQLSIACYQVSFNAYSNYFG